ncbi:MAG TPA: GNAT family N-acetyltransferase, partial [Paraburkholderia sp.]
MHNAANNVASSAENNAETNAKTNTPHRTMNVDVPMIHIQTARFPEQLEIVRTIFREYAESLGIDLSFQNFDSELADLPGKFAPPRGRVLLAYHDDELIGCVAVRPLDDTTCEMKRLYVRPAGRGLQAGKQLATLICTIA